MVLVVKNPPANADLRDAGSIPRSQRSLEEGMANQSSILAWRIPWREDPGGLQFMGSQRVRHDWASEHTCNHWIRNLKTRLLVLSVAQFFAILFLIHLGLVFCLKPPNFLGWKHAIVYFSRLEVMLHVRLVVMKWYFKDRWTMADSCWCLTEKKKTKIL